MTTRPPSGAIERTSKARQSPGETVIDVRDLSKAFGRFVAVDRLTFSVGRGEIFGFLGPNGAGKSTTIRMLSGLLSSTSGTAAVGGFDINREPELLRSRIGYMSQRFSLYPDLTVAENMNFFGGIYGLDNARLKQRTAEVTALASLAGLEDRLAGTLSGAFQQRLALGCAILHGPPILFLDEPTSGVDPISRRAFWDLIQDMASRGVTVLVTTHFMDEAEFCDRIGLISGGRLIALNTPSGIKSEAVDGDLFEVEFGAPGRIGDILGKIEGLEACSYFGPYIHAFCRSGFHTADTLKAALSGLGLTVRTVRPASVTLEDAFIRLVQERTLAGPMHETAVS